MADPINRLPPKDAIFARRQQAGPPLRADEGFTDWVHDPN
jgi:hypothetical protein